MAENTEIGWTHFPRPDGTLMPGHTVNLWWGCEEVHEGCDHCYAKTLAERFGYDIWGPDKPRMIIRSAFNDLARYQKKAAAANEMHAIFIDSMSDIFEKPMKLVDNKGNDVRDPVIGLLNTGHLRAALLQQILDGMYPNLLFLLLTKRPSNINKMIPGEWKENPPANVMFGTSPVNQKTADNLIPHLLKVKGRKFLSIEPMLGPIELNIDIMTHGIYVCPECGSTDCRAVGTDEEYEGMECNDCESFCETRGGIDWVICGGESGGKKRPFDPDWARAILKQCKEWMIPFFMKQMDKVKLIPDDLLVREFPKIAV